MEEDQYIVFRRILVSDEQPKDLHLLIAITIVKTVCSRKRINEKYLLFRSRMKSAFNRI